MARRPLAARPLGPLGPLGLSALGLSTGHHVLTLQSMLITATANFTSR